MAHAGVKLFLAQILNYATITFNYRAIAQADYLWTGVSDVVVASVTYFTISRIAQAQSWVDRVGFVAGSVAGSLIGIKLSQIFL